MALLSQLSSSHFVRHRESWLPAQAPQLKFNLLTECMWNSFVGHVTVVLPPEKTPLLAKTYLLFERGAAEEPAATSTRPWPSSVDGLLAFYCWKLLTAGRCLLLLEALLLRRLWIVQHRLTLSGHKPMNHSHRGAISRQPRCRCYRPSLGALKPFEMCHFGWHISIFSGSSPYFSGKKEN